VLTELVTEAIVQEQRRRIEERLRQRALVAALEQQYGQRVGGLRWSAHWLGVGLERLGTSLQVKQPRPVQAPVQAQAAARSMQR
jgi:hypothetical protein